MSLFLFLSQLLNGLLDGFYYLLIAIGLSLIFSLGGIVNLAHGAFFAIGAYLAIALTPYTGFFGAVILVPLIVAGLGMIVERLLFTRFYRADPLYSLLLTFGLAMIIEQALRWSFGAAPLAYNMPELLRGQVFIGDFIYSRYRIFLITVAVLAVAALWLLLNRTAFGRIVRAGIQNPDILGAMGISLRPYLSVVAGIGIGLAGLAGMLMAPIVPVHPAMGTEVLTAAFVVVVIGGLGSFWGVVLAAILVGVVKGFVIGIDLPSWSLAAIYLLMFLVLLLRPRGLMGERILRFE
ncbi:branched-chain amino acid ABC transporter permease [Paracoccus onubensis]|uniref:Branched-chain amino acid ABC transporter permease n=1 Tax=Paracoccus onubensis TaxID=1675788 RepID=A0A418SU88_9RHOB|nr:branched-chain amino acid ABC transporter permease [Paracoccus onubensis]RJE84521.1 branched-chain amino acid ABC transporter permease [Paracoccus onubensis]